MERNQHGRHSVPPNRSSESEAARLAAEYCAHLADGKSPSVERYLQRLETEEAQAEFQEIVASAKLAIDAVHGSSKPKRVLNARYRLDDEIGVGGMGRVFRAWTSSWNVLSRSSSCPWSTWGMPSAKGS